MTLLDFRGSPHGGIQKHLPEWQSQPRITPTTIIDHSIVGSGLGAFNMFRDTSSLESHFIVLGRRSGANDGMIWQLMDTNRQADANLQANGYAVSIETEDDTDPDRQPWTAAQLQSLAWLHDELRRIHPTIPRRESRSCGDPGGLGYHTLHGAPSCWTPVSKSCPGTVRKQQWRATLLPAFLTGATTEPEPPKEWWEVPIPDSELAKIQKQAEEALMSDAGQAAIRKAVKAENDGQYRLIARGEYADGTSNPDSVHYKDSNRGLTETITHNQAVGLTALDPTSITATIKAAAVEALAGVEVGGGASAEAVAEAVANLAASRLAGG